MKYVFVLISNNDDYFLEQLLVSLVSLHLKTLNPDIIILTDYITSRTLTGKRSEIYKLSNHVEIIDIPSELNSLRRSRWLKTTMRRYIKGDFLYIDCDTVVSADLSDISDVNANLGAVLDQHTLVKEHQLQKRFYNLDKQLGFFSAISTNMHFNSGVLLCRDLPIVHKFFEEWHKLWLYSISRNIEIDQPSFNQAGVKFKGIITEMNGKWNCQIEFSGLQYLSAAKIIHYFTSNRNRKPFIPANVSFLKTVKKTGNLSIEIKRCLENPRILFDSNVRLISDKRMLDIIDSSLFDFLLTRTFNENDTSAILNSLSSFVAGVRKIKGKLHDFFTQ